MERSEAVALLKKLSTSNLIQPSMILMETQKQNKFSLVLKTEGDNKAIEEFVEENKLLLEEKDNGYFIIYKKSI